MNNQPHTHTVQLVYGDGKQNIYQDSNVEGEPIFVEYGDTHARVSWFFQSPGTWSKAKLSRKIESAIEEAVERHDAASRRLTTGADLLAALPVGTAVTAGPDGWPLRKMVRERA